MFFISHRGNLIGPNKEKENHPTYIELALEKGFDVEIDIFYINKILWLGHDEPQYKIKDINWLKNKKLWCHAKNIEALHFLIDYKDIHSFWHQNDDVTLTSKGFIWTYPNKPFYDKSIIVITKNISFKNIPNCLGVCSDYISNLKTNT